MAPFTFGITSRLVDIHFPDRSANPGRPPKGPNASYPWYWWIGPPEKPFYFQFEGGKWGNGWQRTQAFPQIRILGVDTQGSPVPTPTAGYNTLQAAIEQSTPNLGWGRFRFSDPFFWQVMGVKKPEFEVIQGRPTQTVKQPRVPPIAQIISKTVHDWVDRWNFGANDFNQKAAAGVSGAYYQFPQTKFALPLPTDPTIQGLLAKAGTFYLGPIPGGFWFGGGNVAIYKQAYSFKMNCAQLDLRQWDQSVFPPQPIDINSTFETFDCSGYGASDFPLSGPQIIGGE